MFAVLANRTYRPLFLAQVAALADTGLSTVAHYQRRGLAGASPLPEGAGRVTLEESPRIRAVLRRAVRLQLPRTGDASLLRRRQVRRQSALGIKTCFSRPNRGVPGKIERNTDTRTPARKIGRPTCRERVCQYV